MKSAIIENGIVINVIKGSLPDSIECSNDVGPGWLYDGETFTPPPMPELSAEEKANKIRLKRDSYLKSSDWTQLADAPLSESEKQLWSTYRQELRNIPQQLGFPDNVVWPTLPQ